MLLEAISTFNQFRKYKVTLMKIAQIRGWGCDIQTDDQGWEIQIGGRGRKIQIVGRDWKMQTGGRSRKIQIGGRGQEVI